MATGHKDTVWGARHKIEEEELNRIIKEYDDKLKINITKLEASAIQAFRSKNTFLDLSEAKKMIRRLRGIDE
jgi:hypothetical protein